MARREALSLEEWTIHSLNSDPLTMVLLAWESGVAGATMAVVDRADGVGLDMRCLDTSGSNVHKRIEYAAPCVTKNEVRRAIIKLRDQATRPRLPWSISTVLSVVMWALIVFAWGHLHGIHVLEERIAKQIGLHPEDVPPSRRFMAMATAAIVGTNALMGLAVARLAYKFQFSNRRIAAWFALSCFAGYPAAQKMLQLKKVVVDSYKVSKRKAKRH